MKTSVIHASVGVCRVKGGGFVSARSRKCRGFGGLRFRLIKNHI